MKKVWLSPFAWCDADEPPPPALHFELELFLRECGWPDDDAHRAKAEKILRDAMAAKAPAARITRLD